MKRYDILCLSPHFDDVVLSCGGRLIKEVREGKSVLIATLFSEAVTATNGHESNESRKREDANAMKVFGTDNIWLGFADAPWRAKRYHDFSKLVSTPEKVEDELQSAACAKVAATWQESGAKQAFLPLAVGEHIDHRLTYQTKDVLKDAERIDFYEDRPYAFLDGIIEARISLLGATISGEGDEVSNKFPQDLHALGMMINDISNVTIFRNTLSDANKRFIWALKMARRIKEVELSGATLEPHLLRFTQQEFETVVKGVQAYESQIGGLFGDMENFRKESQRYVLKLDRGAAYSERFWHWRKAA